MNTIGNNIQLPVLTVAPKEVSVPAPRSTQVPRAPEPQAPQWPDVSEARVLAERAAAAREVQQQQPRADSRVLGTEKFVSFSVGGLLVTRYRDENGKVRYEPQIDPFADRRPGRRVNLEV